MPLKLVSIASYSEGLNVDAGPSKPPDALICACTSLLEVSFTLVAAANCLP